MNSKLFRGGLAAGVAGVVVLSLGLVLNHEANFSKGYVHDELADHKITFAPVERLKESQKKIPCLVENAGKRLLTASQAECYAKYQIGIDMLSIDNGRGYAEVNGEAFALRAKVDEAVKNRPDDPETKALVARQAELTRKGSSLLAGETVKGLLLTAYGFGLLGEKAGQAATASFLVAGALFAAMVVTWLAGAVGKRRSNRITVVLPELSEVRSPVAVG